MINGKNAIDTHPELLIQRYGNGIKLVRPGQSQVTQMTVGSLLAKPFNVYFLNRESAAQVLNEQTLMACGWESNVEIARKSVMDVWGKTDAMRAVIANDKEVVDKKEIRIVEEDVVCKEGRAHNSLSVKLPWYNAENKVIGLLGCTLVIGMPGFSSLANFITILAKENLLNHAEQIPGLQIENNYFSKREKEILYYLIRGKTAKQIGRILGISFRTIEHHVENIKTKMGVRTKSELIENFITHLEKSGIESAFALI